MNALGITQQLASHIIRPARASYIMSDLGETVFEYRGIVYERVDFTVPGDPKGDSKRLEGSMYRVKGAKETRPTLVYLHANSSSRVTVKNYLKNLIQHFDVVAFDFRGCGNSEGAYLTLGYLQKYDVKAVLAYIDRTFGSRRYMLWGRSMGAVTAITYTAEFGGQSSDKIAALVLDSPFADLEQVIHSLGEKKMPLLPSFMVQNLIDNLQTYISQKITTQYSKPFLIRSHKPLSLLPKIRIPIFFIGSKNDQLVDCRHLEQLYDRCLARKQMEILEGGHNETRPEHLKVGVVEFLVAALKEREQVARKKIFEFGKVSPFGVVKEGEQQAIQQQKYKQKSKSKPKNRLFKDDPKPVVHNESKLSSILSNPQQKQQSIQKQKQKQKSRLKQKEGSLLKTVQTHAEILDKVLPQNSERRKNRIFQFLPKSM